MTGYQPWKFRLGKSMSPLQKFKKSGHSVLGEENFKFLGFEGLHIAAY